jgi:hypothetical protein
MTVDGRVDPEGELDDALTWDGDEERGLEAPRRRRAALGGDDPAGADDELDGDVGSDVDGDDEPVGTTGGVLVVYGILAGVTLISMLTWISVIGASGVSFTDLLGELMYQFGEFLAIAGPGLWFAAVLVLGRDLAPRRRIRWHLVGLVVTAPWPILLGALA